MKACVIQTDLTHPATAIRRPGTASTAASSSLPGHWAAEAPSSRVRNELESAFVLGEHSHWLGRENLKLGQRTVRLPHSFCIWLMKQKTINPYILLLQLNPGFLLRAFSLKSDYFCGWQWAHLRISCLTVHWVTVRKSTSRRRKWRRRPCHKSVFFVYFLV